MHTAIMAAENLESPRPVKILLFNAAPTDIKNNNGDTPLDMAKRIEDDLGDMIVRLLTKKGGLMEYF